MPRKHRAEIIGLVLLAVLALLSMIRRDLFVGDETKYAQIVREMHAGGAILVPTLNGEPYTHKPPLHFWMIYALTVVGGRNALWPYVLPGLLSAVALVWMTARLGRRWVGRDAAVPTGFFLAGLAMVWALAQLARMDLMFACFTTAGSVALFDWIDGGRRRDVLAAGFWFGVAGLVKGPAAGLILLGVFLFESVALRRRPRLADAWLLLLAAVVPLLWFVPAVISAGTPFLEEILMRQTAGRAVSSWVHREPPWYYLVASPAIVFPWFFPLLASFPAMRDTKNPNLARCARWILAILVPFSLVSSKLPVYMVPAFPPVAILAAWYVQLPTDGKRWRGLVIHGHRVGLAILAIVPAVALSGVVPIPGDEAALLDVPGIRVAFALMALAALVGLVAGWSSVGRACLVLPFVIALPAAIALTAAAPAVNDLASSRPLVDELARQVRPHDKVGLYYTPHLWSREDMPPELEAARQLDAEALGAEQMPDLVAVRSDKTGRVRRLLERYDQVSAVEFMGKTFNVYRRR